MADKDDKIHDHTICQLLDDPQTKCGSYLMSSGIIFHIDGLTLCHNHTSEYMHQKCSSCSVYRNKFDKLKGKMVFTS